MHTTDEDAPLIEDAPSPELPERVQIEQLMHDLQAELAARLWISRVHIKHEGEKGTETELNWIDTLRAFLPSRYQVDSAMVVDYLGNRSHQIDVVIYDRQYCPFLFRGKNFLYVPAESVYAVFEVKQTLAPYFSYAGEKAESVRKLGCTSVEFISGGVDQDPRPTTPILSGLLALQSGWTQANTTEKIKSKLRSLVGDQTLDFTCALDYGTIEIERCKSAGTNPEIPKKGDSKEIKTYPRTAYKDVNRKIHIYKNASEGAPITQYFQGTGMQNSALMSFLFRLFVRLQAIGTVPAIDMAAYATFLNNVVTEDL